MDKKVISVLGPIDSDELGLTDAHNHIWISKTLTQLKNAPVLDRESLILEELIAYRQVGGRSQLDCQPGGAGRDGNKLYQLSQASKVNIIANTGFHLKEYYPEESNIWQMDMDQAGEYFLSEIDLGLEETRNSSAPVFPGFIKIAVRENLDTSPQHLMKAAAMVSKERDYLIEMHTQKGSEIERFVQFFDQTGMNLDKLVICHIDKRPDLGLHKELAQTGCLLEYDTFFRPKYEPEKNLWPLIKEMVADGYGTSIACATDLAESVLWQKIGGGPGLVGFIELIKNRLEADLNNTGAVEKLVGGNIASRLAV